MITEPPRFAPAITAAVVVFVFATMLVLEHFRPLRTTVEPKFRRNIRNLGVGAIAFALATIIQLPVLIPLSRWVAARKIGLLHLAEWPCAVHVIAAVALLDYTLWIWHWANHSVPFLWRFHLVHHIDRDLDSSTAFRFHFGEHVLSLLYRSAQIVVIGTSPLSVWVWQLMLFASILFHHANVALPVNVERALVRIIVTPRMHGIHHSDYRNETNSNWSSLFSFWDYLHRTILLSVPQRDVVIGVPAFPDERQVRLGKILVLPFRRRGSDWQGADGAIRVRPHHEPFAALAP
ncbi:MAG TPA: sterol desaturase family protein [Thermoanaerobaculia bacterium]|nr:sterol desaturase family protein [Thermoanaerobaculia bacterium]